MDETSSLADAIAEAEGGTASAEAECGGVSEWQSAVDEGSGNTYYYHTG